jgi:hypothetical protein
MERVRKRWNKMESTVIKCLLEAWTTNHTGLLRRPSTGGMSMNNFFTWETLATFAGCAAATAVITQFLKSASFFKNIATQWVSYFVAVILLLGATYFTGALTWSSGALIPFNAVIIALSANGAYSAVLRATGTKENK